MFPYVQAEPCSAHGPLSTRHPKILRSGIAPEVGVMVRHEPAAAVHFLCGHPAVRAHTLNKIVKRICQLGEIAGLRTPVIHLGIYVYGKTAAPCRPHILVPDALQIGGQRPLAARSYQQIAGVVPVKLDERIILPAISESFKTFVGGKTVAVFSEAQLCAGIISLVVIDVSLQKLVKAFRRCFLYVFKSLSLVIGASVFSPCTYKDHDLIAATAFYKASVWRDIPAFCDCLYSGGKAYAVRAAAVSVKQQCVIGNGGVVIKIIISAVDAYADIYPLGNIAAYPNGKNSVRLRAEDIATYILTVQCERTVRDRGLKIQRSCFIFCIAAVKMRDGKISQRHIMALVYRRAAKSIKHDRFGFLDLFIKKKISYFLQVLEGRRVVSLPGSSRKYRILIEHDLFAHRLTEHHSADPAVPDRQSAVPVLGG